MQKIHCHVFHPIYDWAGEFRTINIYKSEKMLGGLSVIYSDTQYIQSDLEKIFEWSTTVHWSTKNQQLAQCFSKIMTDIWRVHPFREGNTRTVSIFMKLFADASDLQFNEQLLSQNTGYLRSALALAAVKEAPDPQYLHKMITDALGLIETEYSPNQQANDEKYQVIDQHHVANYKEKPFTTKNTDLDNNQNRE